MGLLVLLKDHGGAEDLALLADDLELEIDEILPAVEWAEALGLVTVGDGRAVLSEVGKTLLSGNIRARKTQIRDRLKNLKLFSHIVRSLETSPDHQLTSEQVAEMLARIALPSEDALQHVINWGRFADLFRFNSEENVLTPSRSRAKPKAPLQNAGV